MTKIVDGIARPVFDYLVKTAAQGSLFYIDDTWVRILAIIKANKEATCKKDKKGMHTTGLISHVDGRLSCWHYSFELIMSYSTFVFFGGKIPSTPDTSGTNMIKKYCIEPHKVSKIFS